jgi:uncharacterized membrane protein
MDQSDKSPIAIEDVSAWVLRIGIVLSALTMLTGIFFSFAHGTVSVQRMKTDPLNDQPAVIWRGICHGSGKSIIEAGIYLLVFTPIMRVLASFILFAVAKRDWVYSLITLVVLILTLTGLLWIK